MEKPIQTRHQTRKEQAERLQAVITELLQCSQAQYNELQYKEGLKYLKYYLPGDKHSADLLSRSKVFWAWWKNHWINRDVSFMCLHESNPIRDLQIRLQLYLQYNDGRHLAQSITPNSVVLDESYAEMITELVKSETQNS
jgi:hypothetical protein